MKNQCFSNPMRSYGFVLHDVARLMRRNLDRRIQTIGLSHAQWRALAHIARNPGLNQAKLADFMEVQPISVARLIDRMEASGWVERRPDPTDRRAVQLHLTDKADPILDQMWGLIQLARDEATKGISEDEKDALLDILLRMRANLTQNEA